MLTHQSLPLSGRRVLKYTHAMMGPTAGLLPTALPDGTRTKLPCLPREIGNYDLGVHHDPPAIGADTAALLVELDYSMDDMPRLREIGTIA
jgi:crotonobetainyl-CoA:carnitine CoA-transferase CaiB-like acyl-CoA transferase